MEEPNSMHPETLLKLTVLGSFAFTFLTTLHVIYSSEK